MSRQPSIAADLSALDLYEQSIDRLNSARRAVERLGGFIDAGDTAWMMTQLREIAEVAQGTADIITAEARNLEAVKVFSVDYVRRAG